MYFNFYASCVRARVCVKHGKVTHILSWATASVFGTYCILNFIMTSYVLYRCACYICILLYTNLCTNSPLVHQFPTCAPIPNLCTNSPLPHQPETQQQQTDRFEQIWHYTYAVGFRSSGSSLRIFWEKPRHLEAYTVFTSFLLLFMVLVMQHYIILAFDINWCTSWSIINTHILQTRFTYLIYYVYI